MAAGVAGYGTGFELHEIEFTRHDMRIPGLPPALEGARLLQLSDLHVGRRVSHAYLVSVMRRAAAYRPDLVVMTGDFVTWHGHEAEPLASVLAAIPEAPLGRFAVLGNHDYGRGWRQREVGETITRVARAHGFRVLRNERASVDGLVIAGVDDAWGPHFDLARTLAGLDPRTPAVLLCHNPDVCDYPGWGGYRGWVLSGHTHGGQVKPPFLPPPVLPIRNPRYAAGLVALADGRRLYVSRGVGHNLPIRINVRPEVPVFTLRAA